MSFRGSYGSVQDLVLVEDVLKMSWDRRGVVCSWAPVIPSAMHMQIKVGSWDQLYFNFIIVPAAAAADEAGGGAAEQANTLHGYIRDCCAKYVNLKKLTLNLSRCIIEGELMDFELNAEEILDGIYYY